MNEEIYAKQEEIRSLVKSIIMTTGDIVPDYKQKTLTIKLYAQTTPRHNLAMEKLCVQLNDSETLYPGTEFRLIYILVTN